MRLNPFQAHRDYTAKRALKAALLQAVKKLPPGGGVELDRSQQQSPLYAAALMELLKEEDGKLTVVKTEKSWTLCRTRQMALSSELRNTLDRDGYLINPGDDLNE
ncbi:MAG: hypothetical protein Q7R39_16810 [Dehalococcoidia bacterium]|nr:hypothetical protein [Dehalococcoidia bacterium]